MVFDLLYGLHSRIAEPRVGGGRGVVPYNSLMGICRPCLRADVSYFLCATKEIGDVCTQANAAPKGMVCGRPQQ